MTLCKRCGYPESEQLGPHQTYLDCFAAIDFNISKLLEAIAGVPGSCRGCREPVFWVTHKNGKKTPYNARGFNHFIDCTARDQFKTKKEAGDGSPTQA